MAKADIEEYSLPRDQAMRMFEKANDVIDAYDVAWENLYEGRLEMFVSLDRVNLYGETMYMVWVGPSKTHLRRVLACRLTAQDDVQAVISKMLEAMIKDASPLPLMIKVPQEAG
jgi:hypothetical protein